MTGRLEGVRGESLDVFRAWRRTPIGAYVEISADIIPSRIATIDTRRPSSRVWVVSPMMV